MAERLLLRLLHLAYGPARPFLVHDVCTPVVCIHKAISGLA